MNLFFNNIRRRLQIFEKKIVIKIYRIEHDFCFYCDDVDHRMIECLKKSKVNNRVFFLRVVNFDTFASASQ